MTECINYPLWPFLFVIVVTTCILFAIGPIIDTWRKLMAPPPSLYDSMVEASSPGLIDTLDPVPEAMYHLNRNKSVAVDPNNRFMSMSTCPRGVKVQLLWPGKIATYGTWDGQDTQWLGWYPVPSAS